MIIYFIFTIFCSTFGLLLQYIKLLMKAWENRVFLLKDASISNLIAALIIDNAYSLGLQGYEALLNQFILKGSFAT